MEVGKTLYVTNRKQWRSWPSKYHKTANDIWLIYYKKQSGKRRIPYNDAVEEALCFGWIDGIRRKWDEASYTVRFTPRKARSIWSTVNRKRAGELIPKDEVVEGLGRLVMNARTHLLSLPQRCVPLLATMHGDKPAAAVPARMAAPVAVSAPAPASAPQAMPAAAPAAMPAATPPPAPAANAAKDAPKK